MPAAVNRLAILRIAESECLSKGVDALSLGDVAKSLGASRAEVAAFFHDEMTLLDAVLERHQTPYERTWGEALPPLEDPRDVLRLLVRSIAQLAYKEDGGHAYLTICAQMCTSRRFPLTTRPASTSPAALQLMGKLTKWTGVPFALMPVRFERMAVVLFSSVSAWVKQGQGRIPDDLFIEDLIDTLMFVSLSSPSESTQRLLDG